MFTNLMVRMNVHVCKTTDKVKAQKQLGKGFGKHYGFA